MLCDRAGVNSIVGVPWQLPIINTYTRPKKFGLQRIAAAEGGE